MSSFLCSSPPFAPSNLRISTYSSSSPPSSPVKGSSRLNASQERRAARLQRPFANVPKSLSHGDIGASGSSDGSSPPKYDPLRAKRRRDHGAALARRRQALFHAARGGDDEMMRFVWLAEKRRWEQELRCDADDMGLSVDELLALENEQLSHHEFGSVDGIMSDRSQGPQNNDRLHDANSADEEMIRMMEIEEQKQLEDAERLYMTQRQKHSGNEVPDIPQDIVELLLEDYDDDMDMDMS
ncbi:hypothetical protein V1523DRAFT_410991 [Lipomyces doorenjongii]